MAASLDGRPPGARQALEWTVRHGIHLCRQGRWEAGLALLASAAETDDDGSSLPSIVYSYLGYGIAREQGDAAHGMALCRHAVQREPGAPENQANLARVMLLAGERASAVRILDHALGLAPGDPLLRRLRQDIGVRRRPTIPLLPRAHALNRALGKVRHRLAPRRPDRRPFAA